MIPPHMKGLSLLTKQEVSYSPCSMVMIPPDIRSNSTFLGIPLAAGTLELEVLVSSYRLLMGACTRPGSSGWCSTGESRTSQGAITDSVAEPLPMAESVGFVELGRRKRSSKEVISGSWSRCRRVATAAWSWLICSEACAFHLIRVNTTYARAVGNTDAAFSSRSFCVGSWGEHSMPTLRQRAHAMSLCVNSHLILCLLHSAPAILCQLCVSCVSLPAYVHARPLGPRWPRCRKLKVAGEVLPSMYTDALGEVMSICSREGRVRVVRDEAEYD